MCEVDYFRNFFPQFDEETLFQRLHTLPFNIATLLDPHHIHLGLSWEVGREGFRSYLSATLEIQQALLTEVLLVSGISPAIANAVGRVRRHLFVPHEYVEFAYLNAWIPFGYFSSITMPGLVALMINRLQPKANESILEIGIGSGYHAACISELTQNTCQIYGIEINRDFYHLGCRSIALTGYKNIIMKEGNGFAGWPQNGQFDRIYIPAAFLEVPPLLLDQLVESGVIQGARVLSPQEFSEEPLIESTRQRFGTYDQYRNGEWRQSVCVSTWRKGKSGLTEISKLFGVKFVLLYRNSADQYKPYPRTSPFSVSLLHFARRFNAGLPL
jgi:protein-L-isoaspartate(D-aspartate) O-methyltransferase